MSKYTNPNQSIISIIEQLQKDLATLERKAEFYEAIWEKMQDLEKAFTDDTPPSYYNKVYAIWNKASQRATHYQECAKDLNNYINTLRSLYYNITDTYSYMND